MILVRREDDFTLNLDASTGTMPHKDGLIVTFPGSKGEVEHWIIEGYSLDQLIKDTKGRWGHLLIIHRHFEAWKPEVWS